MSTVYGMSMKAYLLDIVIPVIYLAKIQGKYKPLTVILLVKADSQSSQ